MDIIYIFLHRTIFGFLLPLKQFFWKLQIYFILGFKEYASKWEQKCGIWVHSWCVYLRSSVRFSVLVCLSALYTEAKNDMYKCSVHILLLSSWGNDCNQSDFLCSGKTKKLHAERYSHVISVMQWAMTENWMACLCARLTC